MKTEEESKFYTYLKYIGFTTFAVLMIHSLKGYWFSEPSVSYGARSIPPGLSPYTKFRVLKPFEVRLSISSPGMFHGQSGFGLQYKSLVNARTLIKKGIISPIK